MHNSSEVLSDVEIPFDISESPPCEIYVNRPLDNDDLAQREISFCDPRTQSTGELLHISYGNARLYRLETFDFDLLVSGIDEVKISFGTYRRKDISGNIKSRAVVTEYRGQLRPVETWVYESVGGPIYV